MKNQYKISIKTKNGLKFNDYPYNFNAYTHSYNEYPHKFNESEKDPIQLRTQNSRIIGLRYDFTL